MYMSSRCRVLRSRSSSGVEAVPVAGWLTGNQDAHLCSAAIQRLVGLARRNLQPLSGTKHEVVMLHLQRQLAGQHIEELPRLPVEVAGLRGAGRHKLLNYIE